MHVHVSSRASCPPPHRLREGKDKSVADHAGIRAVTVHAKDDVARAFYERFHFVRSPTDSYHLLLLMKDVRALLER